MTSYAIGAPLPARKDTMRSPVLPSLLLIGTLFAPAATASPAITNTSDATLARSGRLLLFGSGFGPPGPTSRVVIAGLDAIATTWTDGEIHAYVPEAAPLGATTIAVVTPAGSSNAVPLEVTARVSSGRILWSFQVDSKVSGRTVGRAPDGTLYVVDDQRLYALDPDGGLRWVLDGAGAALPISVASDGTIHTYADGVWAVNPDGTVKWVYAPPNPGQFLIAGPNLGPDGNVYAVQDTAQGGLGVFSVSPAGSLRWSDPGSPSVFDFGGAGNTLVEFGSLADDRLVFGNAGSLPGLPPTLYGFDFGGSQRWTVASSCATFPRVTPSGLAVFARNGTCGITALDVADGTEAWNAPPPQSINSTVATAVGPDGSVYSGDFAGKLWSVSPIGQTQWFVDAPFVVTNLAVSPDNRVLLEGRGTLHAFDPATGASLWSVDLPAEQGVAQLAITAPGPAFSADSQVAYVTTSFVGNGTGYSNLLAISTCDVPASSSSYGAGWPGTQGVPALSLTDAPVLGAKISLNLGNSAPGATSGVLLLGLGPAVIPTSLGGSLALAPVLSVPLVVPAGGASLPAIASTDPAHCGLTVTMQTLLADPGASHGVAFSAGLSVTLGAP